MSFTPQAMASSSACFRKSLISLNNGGSSPSHVAPIKERRNSNASCKTASALALATSSMVDFWNRVSQQMAYIDGSTRSPSLIDGASTRSSLPNDSTRDSLLVAMEAAGMSARPFADNRSSSVVDERNIMSESLLEIEYEHGISILDDRNSNSMSLLNCGNDHISVSVLDDVIAPLRSSDLCHIDVSKPSKQRHPTEITSPMSCKSCSGSRHTATTCSLEASPPLSPRMQKIRSSTFQRLTSNRTPPQKPIQRQASVVNEDEDKRSRSRPWYWRASSEDRQRNKNVSVENSGNEEDQSAIWHHVFTEVGSKYIHNPEKPGKCYKNRFNDDDDDYYYDDDDDDDNAKDGMELELLQPASEASGNSRPQCGTGVIPSSATSTSVVMETASIGGGRMTTRTRLHKYQQQFSFCAGDRRLSVSATK